jgi:predicted TIM-barrel fold metal-dependent hydrolase
VSRRVAALGWHVQLFAPVNSLPELLPRLERLETEVVFDHFGNIPAAAGCRHLVFDSILRLLRGGRAWIKLSGAASLGPDGPGQYDQLKPLAHALLEAAPHRVIWGSDWPHPSNRVLPDDALLMETLAAWCEDAATLHRVLVENPARLYDF